jgi:hypothetical protein
MDTYREIAKLNLRFAIENRSPEIKSLADIFQYDAVRINFLIELLNHAKLEIRALAYKLLQNNVDSDKVRKILATGLLLNPGDRIYTVYRTPTGFDDSSYYLCGGENPG